MSASRQTRPPRRAPLIWVAVMLVLGIAAIAVFNTTRGATRDFDTVAIDKPSSPGIPISPTSTSGTSRSNSSNAWAAEETVRTSAPAD